MSSPEAQPRTRTATHRGSPRMFEHDLFERLSHVHPATPAIIFLPVVAACIAAAVARFGTGIGMVLVAFSAGALAWSLVEYWMHRLVFHLPVRGPRSGQIYFIFHGVHHDYPWDTTRLVMPPVLSIALGVLFYVGFRAALPDGPAHAAFAGFVTGYLIYDTVHYLVHARAPKSALLKHLRRHHLLHHFRDSEARFGVSSPLWDHVFRTTGKD